jgi:hypothetical protein
MERSELTTPRELARKLGAQEYSVDTKDCLVAEYVFLSVEHWLKSL